MFACAQVHQSATVPVPEGSLVPQCWFMSMCYGLRCLTRDWLWTEGPVSQRPRSYVKEVDGSQSTGESQHFLPCQHLQPELLAGRIPIEALNKRPGGTTAGRVSVSLHSLSVAGCMDSIWVIGCVCAEENIWNVMRSEWNTRWCIITEQVWYTLNNKKYAMTCPLFKNSKHHYSGHIFYQPISLWLDFWTSLELNTVSMTWHSFSCKCPVTSFYLLITTKFPVVHMKRSNSACRWYSNPFD